jgi:hypothetical protein
MFKIRKKILITGSDGYVATLLKQWLKNHKEIENNFNLIFLNREELDLGDYNKLNNVLNEIKPEIVFNLVKTDDISDINNLSSLCYLKDISIIQLINIQNENDENICKIITTNWDKNTVIECGLIFSENENISLISNEFNKVINSNNQVDNDRYINFTDDSSLFSFLFEKTKFDFDKDEFDELGIVTFSLSMKLSEVNKTLQYCFNRIINEKNENEIDYNTLSYFFPYVEKKLGKVVEQNRNRIVTENISTKDNKANNTFLFFSHENLWKENLEKGIINFKFLFNAEDFME